MRSGFRRGLGGHSADSFLASIFDPICYVAWGEMWTGSSQEEDMTTRTAKMVIFFTSAKGMLHLVNNKNNWKNKCTLRLIMWQANKISSLEPCNLSMKMSIMLLLRQRYFQGSLLAFCNPFCLPSRKDRRKQIRRWGEKRWVDFPFLFPILSFVSEFFWRKLSIGRWMIRLIRERKQTFFLGVSFICPGTVVRTG